MTENGIDVAFFPVTVETASCIYAVNDGCKASETDSDLCRLGNPKSNALPTCQLKQIQEFVNKTQLPPPLPPVLQRGMVLPSTSRSRSADRAFWLNTLYIPVGH